jgi:predicted lipoprotein with Yx(FWY)xxD motif
MKSKAIGALVLVSAVAGPLAAAGAATSAAGRRTTPVTVAKSKYGRVLFDGKGRSLYLFAKDRRGKSSCYGACAKAWPPLLTKSSALHAGKGARMGLLGTTRRRDGRLQVTYAGHPLYGFASDTKRGQITCQNVSQFGGKWLVVTPAGKAVH